LTCDNGTSEAFARIVAEYRKAVLDAAVSRVGSIDLADDVAQVTFICLYQRMVAGGLPSHLGPWLRSVGRLQAALLRRRAPREYTRTLEAYELEPAAPGAEAPLELAERHESIFKLYRALADLPQRCLSIVQLRVAGKSTKAIAAQLGVSARTVRSDISYARDRLQDWLRDADSH
jgi:RNA polymerase sigma factor (sigma-70 family)